MWPVIKYPALNDAWTNMECSNYNLPQSPRPIRIVAAACEVIPVQNKHEA